MGSVVIGLLVVAAGAVGFGVVLFGRGPAVQTDTRQPSAWPIGWSAGTGDSPHQRGVMGAIHRWRVRRSPDLVPSGWVRLRSALVLGLTVLGIAAMIGGLLSVVVVGLVFL